MAMKECRWIVICLISFIFCILSGCKENAPSFTTYTGVVVEQNSMNPLAGLQVRVTDGSNVYSEAITNNAGQFSLDMAHNSSLGQVYLFIDGGSVYPSKKVDLVYTDDNKYDYGLIYLYSQTDESLFPVVESVSWDYPSDGKSLRFKDVVVVSSYELREVYVNISQSAEFSTTQKIQLERQSNGNYSGIVSNLSIGEKYYFQVFAKNTIGSGKSEVYGRTFGMANPSIVGLKSATISSAIISIKVTEEPLTTLSAGICWSTSHNPTTSDQTSTGSSKVEADVSMDGLDFSKKSYYVRAFATNANGTSYSEELELPANNPYNLPTFKSGGYTYAYKYMGKGSWYTAYNACESFVFVFDDWKLPNIRIMPDFFNTYYAENGETLKMPVWSMRNDEYWESGESETFMLTTNGEILASKSQSAHYYAVRKY